MSLQRWIFCLTALLLPAAAVGEKNHCDPGLPRDPASPVTYRMRDDRCEGYYNQQVSSVSVEVRSVVAAFGPFDPEKDAELALTWRVPSGSIEDARLRAFSLKYRVYYRMDTAVPAVRGSYRWPSDLLATQKLGGADLGLLAWLDRPGPGGSTRQVYLPLQAGRAAKDDGGARILLVPSKKLAKVYIAIHRIDDQGKTLATLRPSQELGWGIYPKEEPIEISTGRLGPEGFYRAEITARLEDGASIARTIDLYHPGEKRR